MLNLCFRIHCFNFYGKNKEKKCPDLEVRYYIECREKFHESRGRRSPIVCQAETTTTSTQSTTTTDSETIATTTNVETVTTIAEIETTEVVQETTPYYPFETTGSF